MALPRSPRQRILATPRREYLPAPGPQLFLLSVSTARGAGIFAGSTRHGYFFYRHPSAGGIWGTNLVLNPGWVVQYIAKYGLYQEDNH